jgi:hypothetical protein
MYIFNYFLILYNSMGFILRICYYILENTIMGTTIRKSGIQNFNVVDFLTIALSPWFLLVYIIIAMAIAG